MDRIRRQTPLWPGLMLAALLAVLAFVISFDALRTVGLACGINPRLSWMFPLIVDGSTLMFTWATWAFKTRGIRTGYPWAMLVMFSVCSLIGNALHAHAVRVNGMLLPDWVPPLVMTMPPVALLAATHMMVTAAGRTFDDRIAMDEPDKPSSDLDAMDEPVEPVPGFNPGEAPRPVNEPITDTADPPMPVGEPDEDPQPVDDPDPVKGGQPPLIGSDDMPASDDGTGGGRASGALDDYWRSRANPETGGEVLERMLGEVAD